MNTERPWPTFDELVRGLEDPDRFARCRAAQGLGKGRDPRAFEPLLRALRDPAGDVRAKAAVALGRLRDERAVGPLIAALGDAKVSVRTGAAAALKKFGKRAYAPLLEAYRGAGGPARLALLGVLAGYRTAEVFRLLLDAYRGECGRNRTVLLDAIARHATPAASEFLIATLGDPDPAVHLQVVGLLARRKDRRAVEPLVAALADARAAFEHVLRDRDFADDECSLDRLREATAGWSELIARLDAYVRALGVLGDAGAFEPLQELLEVEGMFDQVGLVMAVVRALRTIDNARTVDLLHVLLDDPSHPGRDRLEMALAGMDLLNASRALATRAAGGDLAAVRDGLAALRECHQEFRSHGLRSSDEAEVRRIGTELMRQVEGVLRGLGRGRSGANGPEPA